ncbi:PTS sugar transporter subunit IIB, partial [Clostridium saudiense]|nr:PTS sugar transporter subunit IIB [Clostridium saudiense]
VKYLLDDTKQRYGHLNKPIFVINMQDYGVMDGEKVLKTAIMHYKKQAK